MSTILFTQQINSVYTAEIRQDKGQGNYTVIITADGRTVAKKDYATKGTAKQAIKNIAKRL